MGFQGRSKNLGMTRLRCPRCGQEAFQHMVRSQRWFTLFFVPVFPLGSRYLSTCTFCGFTQRVDAQLATSAVAMPGDYAGSMGPPPPPPWR
jgi:ribosomal protein L37E